MRKQFKDYTKEELDKLMNKKWKAMNKKYPDYNANWMSARDELFDWYDAKLELIN